MKEFSGVHNLNLREIYCELTYGMIPTDREKLRCNSTISFIHYSLSQYPRLKESVLELINPLTGETLCIEELDEVWRRHAAKTYEAPGRMTDIRSAIEVLQDDEHPLHLLYQMNFVIRVVAPHQYSVPKYMCIECEKRYFDPVNRERCRASHPRQVGYDPDQIITWWDSLPEEDRVELIGGAHKIYLKDIKKVYSVKKMKGRKMVEIMQQQLEQTFLLRIGHFDHAELWHSVHQVSTRILERFTADQRRVLIEREENVKKKQVYKIVKGLIKRSYTSDDAFKKLTGTFLPLQWYDEEEEDVATDVRAMIRLS